MNAITGPGYWDGIAAAMSNLLRESCKVDALTATIHMIEETMADHWPPEASNPNELSNALHCEARRRKALV